MKSFFQSRLFLIVLACMTLGLAPYHPEPHLLGKIRWIMGGAHGIQAMDWYDLCLHLSPWVLLVIVIIQKWKRKLSA